MNTTKRQHPYKVRKQTSGYNGGVKYIVVKNPGAQRVTVNAHTNREAAQADADWLNVAAMVKPADEDPRPYDVRFAEAQAIYNAEKA